MARGGREKRCVLLSQQSARIATGQTTSAALTATASVHSLPRLTIHVSLVMTAYLSCAARHAGSDAGALSRASCDSTSAVRIALDSLRKLDTLPSTVLRFQSDTNGFRVVTMVRHAYIRDGMSIVRISATCRILSLVQTDSA